MPRRLRNIVMLIILPVIAILVIVFVVLLPKINTSPATNPQRAAKSTASIGTTSPSATASPTGPASSFQLIGHDALFNRGMNSALAFYQQYIYIGNRTDGSSTCGVGDPR